MTRSRARPRMWCKLCRDRREEATTGIDPSRQVLKKGFGQRHDASDPAHRIRGLANHIAFKDLSGRVDGRQFEVLFGLEMRIEPALTHTNVPGELADRKPFQSMGCGESSGRIENGAATLNAICASLRSASGAGFAGNFAFLVCGHIDIIARSVVLSTNERSCYLLFAAFPGVGRTLRPARLAKLVVNDDSIAIFGSR